MAGDDHIAVVVLASAGRPELLRAVIGDLRSQTRPVDRLILAVPNDDSLPSGDTVGCEVVYEARGLAAQRNAGMRAAPEASVYFFFDDDAVVRNDYVERALAHFDADQDVVGLTGNVLLDGAASEAIDPGAAVNALHRSASDAPPTAPQPTSGLYGCNFAVRRVAEMVYFDDRLPLYSWLEDRDFSNRLRRRGRTVRVEDCVIVHLGAKSGGRMAHTRLGFTQVMNPAYFVAKHSFGVGEALREIGRPVAMNLVRSVSGSERHWRRKRLYGNLIAVTSILRRDLRPERMTDLH